LRSAELSYIVHMRRVLRLWEGMHMWQYELKLWIGVKEVSGIVLLTLFWLMYNIISGRGPDCSLVNVFRVV
jgi:hypothetical protein